MPQENTVVVNSAKIFDEVANTVREVRGKVEDFGRRATERMNEGRGSAASGLESAASTIHEKAYCLPGGEKATQAAHSTADKLSATARYVKTHEMKDMLGDAGQIFRRNPAQSLLAAVAVGFLAGRAFRGNTK